MSESKYEAKSVGAPSTVDRRYEIAGTNVVVRCPADPLGQLVAHLVLSGQSYPVVELPKPRPTILDVGANIGAAAIFFAANYPGATIHAVEPNPGCMDLLRRNIRPFTPSISAHPIALADRDDEMSLFLGESDSVTASLAKSSMTSEAAVTVSVRDAGSWMREEGLDSVDILKIDTEGAEVHIIRSIPRALIASISVLYIEFHSETDRLWICLLYTSDAADE